MLILVLSCPMDKIDGASLIIMTYICDNPSFLGNDIIITIKCPTTSVRFVFLMYSESVETQHNETTVFHKFSLEIVHTFLVSRQAINCNIVVKCHYLEPKFKLSMAISIECSCSSELEILCNGALFVTSMNVAFDCGMLGDSNQY